MDELILRSLQGRTSDQEEASLQKWRMRAPENEERYSSLRQLWAITQGATPIRRVAAPDVDELIARARFRRSSVAELERVRPGGAALPSGDPRRSGSERSAPGPRWLRRAAIGALAAGLVGIGLGVGAVLEERTSDTGILSRGEIVTGVGEMTTLTLADGSSIRLGPESRLRLSEEGEHRQAWLEGRAFFGVQSDSTRPFTVHTELGEARVLGTRFEVRTEDEEFRVLVVEGEVAVSVGEDVLRITDGELSRSRGGARPTTEQVDDVYASLDWLGNAIVFQATPLDRALREIERRYSVDVRLDDPALASFSVTASFTGQSVEEVAFVLCEIVGAECVIDGDEIRMDSQQP